MTDSEFVHRLRAMALMLPEATEIDLFGNPTFRIATNTFATFEQLDGAPVVSVKLDLDHQAALVGDEGFDPAPETGPHGWTNIRLDLVAWDTVDGLLVDSYRGQAPPHCLAALDSLLAAAGVDD